ncbi:hypothetical protein FXB39_19495 [Nocardioides sp. BGMRC 2183]|nr:hypothetical protein FXB39_19495 [Nocardioides sp. BGMRC 2183]
MIGHLGTRVSALLDGQMPAAEAEDAWAHVYACHRCRDLVEREGWVKTRLAGLDAARATPADLKGSLLNLTPGEQFIAAPNAARRPVSGGFVLISGGALGAALLGVVALGVTPGAGPADRRPPVTQINQSTPTPSDGNATQRTRPARGSAAVRNVAERLPAPVDRFFG